FLSNSRPVANALLAMIDDSDPRVQLQIAFTLGQMKDQRALDALATLAVKHSEDQWFRFAIISSVADKAYPFFQLLRARDLFKAIGSEMIQQLAAPIGAKQNTNEITQFVTAVVQRPLGHFRDGQVATLYHNRVVVGLTGLTKGLKLSNARNLRAPGIETILS